MSEAELRVGVSVRTLVPGDPEDLDRLAARFSQLGEGMLDSAWQLVTMDDKIWEGKAAEAFHHVISDEPRTFERAGTAFEDAARATRLWAVALREAQEAARQAIARFEEAEAVSRAWRTSAAEPAQAADGTSGADLGEEERAEARRDLAQARADLITPASSARAILGDAADLAPRKRGWFDRVTGGVGDFVAGAWDGASGVAGALVSTVEAVLEDPGEFLLDTWDNLYDSIAVWNWDTFSSTWIAFGKEFLAWDEWAKNPFRALGRVAFNVALTWATVGAGKLVQKLIGKRKRNRAPPEHEVTPAPGQQLTPEQSRVNFPLSSRGGYDRVARTARSDRHILEGESGGKGGHRPFTGRPGKTEFPDSWSDEKILEAVDLAVQNPLQAWESTVSAAGRAKFGTVGEAYGLKIQVYVSSEGRIESAFPRPNQPGVPKNPDKPELAPPGTDLDRPVYTRPDPTAGSPGYWTYVNKDGSEIATDLEGRPIARPTTKGSSS